MMTQTLKMIVMLLREDATIGVLLRDILMILLLHVPFRIPNILVSFNLVLILMY
jgi:hypothetical protein